MATSLGVEVRELGLATARDRGLKDARIRAFAEAGARDVFEIRRVYGGTPAAEVLRDTDLVLEMDGVLFTALDQIEQIAEGNEVSLTLLREGEELEVSVLPVALEARGVDRVVQWAGMILHAPHVEVQAQGGVAPEGIYGSWLWFGSPTARYGFRPTRRVVQIDDQPTPDLEAFLEAVRGHEHGQAVRVKTIALDGSVRVQTLKQDLHYWPTQLFELDANGWRRVPFDGQE